MAKTRKGPKKPNRAFVDNRPLSDPAAIPKDVTPKPGAPLNIVRRPVKLPRMERLR